MFQSYPCWIDEERFIISGRDLLTVDAMTGEVLYREALTVEPPANFISCGVTPDRKRVILNSWSVESDVWLAEIGMGIAAPAGNQGSPSVGGPRPRLTARSAAMENVWR